jgi:GT2 family glycosyltransferase
LKAAKEIGGFDEAIKGTGEDVDFAVRMVQAGWSIEQGNAIFYESHSELNTVGQLWKRYVHNGYHGRIFYTKTKFISLFRFNPISSFIGGLLSSFAAFRVLNRKIALLLPFHFFFKMTAWFYGFSTYKIKAKNRQRNI